MLRDWVPVALLLLAYREMDWFSSMPRNFDFELRWVEWDRSLLYHWGLQRAVECAGRIGPRLSGVLLPAGVRDSAVCCGRFLFPAPASTREWRAVFVFTRDASGLRAISLLSFGSAARRVWRERHAAYYNRGAPIEYVADGRLRDSLQRFSERARVVGVFGGLGAIRFSSRTQALWLGNACVCRNRRGSNRVWALSLCGGRCSGDGDQPDPRLYDSSGSVCSPCSPSRPS